MNSDGASFNNAKDMDMLISIFLTWSQIDGFAAQRRFLSAHTELLHTGLETLLSSKLHQQRDLLLWKKGKELEQMRSVLSISEQRLTILRAALAREGDVQTTIRTVYVERYGGLVLDLPPWLEALRSSIEELSQPLAFPQRSVPFLQSVIDRALQDSQIAPEIIAELYSTLGLLLSHDRTEQRQQAIAASFAAFAQVLPIYTQERYPYRYAVLHYDLGQAYSRYTLGNVSDNMEEAIRCYKIALKGPQRQAEPLERATTCNALGVAYFQRIAGDRKGNIEEALRCYAQALTVRTAKAFPASWAMTTLNIGIAYCERVEGQKKENLEQAIKALEAALQFYLSNPAYPVELGKTQHNLGMAYTQRIAGEQKDNLERAIILLTTALLVRTRERFPIEWAQTQNALGDAYKDRIAERQKDNLEQAIVHYKAALEVVTRDNDPLQWATIQNALGEVYSERIEGEKRANIELAITFFDAALDFSKQQGILNNWAVIQSNLGATYLQRIEGERGANIETAIKHCEAALTIFTREDAPAEWANVQHNLGNIYQERIHGESRANLEQGIAHYEAALQVYTKDAFPARWAMVQQNLGSAYRARINGKKEANLECAIACYQAALAIRTYDATPTEWAMTQLNLGSAYIFLNDVAQDHNTQAIHCYKEALRVYTRQDFPRMWVLLQHNLGSAYYRRHVGERALHLEQARHHFEEALQLRTYKTDPFAWARTQQWLGAVYTDQGAFPQAIACCREALGIFTLQASPENHRNVQLRLATIAMQQQRWQDAHVAYTAVAEAEDLLVHLGTGAMGRDLILAEARDAVVNHSFALVHLQQFEAAALVIEQRRARSLSEAFMLRSADPTHITDPQRRGRYVTARQRLIETQAALNNGSLSMIFPEEAYRQMFLQQSQALQAAQTNFDAIIAEIQKAQDPASFYHTPLDKTTLLQAAERGGPGHALIYLSATRWGGFALAVLPHAPSENMRMLELPHLTSTLLEDLSEVTIGGKIVGGYVHAQESGTSKHFLESFAGETLRERAMALHNTCIAASQVSSLDLAVQEMLVQPRWQTLYDTPLDRLAAHDLNSAMHLLWRAILRNELERCFQHLGDTTLAPLMAWLTGLDQHISSLTLIPCGRLAAFPLTSTLLADGRTFGEILPTSVAPAARALLRDESYHPTTGRTGVYALGNPHPTYQNLPWGENEALTVARMARDMQLMGKAVVRHAATYDWLKQALQQGYVVDASCHGFFYAENFLESSLVLAGKLLLSLGQLLSHEIDLRGLRLLILSACQTAVLDIRGAVDEVRSLAAGMLQSGADAVLAVHWTIDDYGTYLLIVRFMQEWLPSLRPGAKPEAPAVVLARAQHWLRTLTWEALGTWQQTELPEMRGLVGEITTSNEPAKTYQRGTQSTEIDTEDQYIYPYANPIYWAAFHITGW